MSVAVAIVIQYTAPAIVVGWNAFRTRTWPHWITVLTAVMAICAGRTRGDRRNARTRDGCPACMVCVRPNFVIAPDRFGGILVIIVVTALQFYKPIHTEF